MTDLGAFLERLRKADFTGELRIRLDHGDVHHIELHHLVGLDELDVPVVVVEKDKEFRLEG